MDIASRIKDAIVPTAQQQQEPVQDTSQVSPEVVQDSIPGAFPDEEELAANPAGKSGGGIPAAQAAPEEKKWTTEETQPRHLGNEGKAIGVGGVDDAGTFPATENAGRLAQEEMSNEGLGQLSGSGSSGSRDPVADAAHQQARGGPLEPNAGAPLSSAGRELGTQSSSHDLVDPSLAAAHYHQQEAQGTNVTRSEIPVAPTSELGQHTTNTAAIRPTEGATLAAANRQQQQPDAASYTTGQTSAAAVTTPGVGPSGGIHNGILGAGSDDPNGEGGEAPHERQSHYRRSDVHSAIPSVWESGLGQGGIHNGVVGHGSKEEELEHGGGGGGGLRE